MKQSSKFQVFIFTFTRWAMNISLRMVYPFLSVFARGLGVDLAGISRVLSLRSLGGICAPLLAPVADRYGRKTGMLLGAFLFLAGSLLMIFWPGYTTFIISMMITMLGTFIYHPSMQAYLSDQIPYVRRGKVLAIVETSWALSFIFGMPFIAFVIDRMDWIAPFYVLSALGLISVILLVFGLPRISTSRLNGHSNLGKDLRLVLNSRTAVAALLMGMIFSAANEIVAIVFGFWLEGSFGLKIGALGLASVVIGIAEFSGESLTAGLVDRLGKKRAILIGLVLNSVFAILLPWIGKTLPGAMIGLFLFYITFEFTLVSSIPIISELMPSLRATLLGINMALYSVGRAFGDWLSPFLFNFGIWANGWGAVALNLLAIAALSQVKIDSDGKES